MGIYGAVIIGFPFAVSFSFTVALALMYLRVRVSRRGILRYFRSNLGAPFIFAFIGLLVAAAIEFSMNMSSEANTLSEYAYFCILIGVVLQAISIKLEKGSEGPSEG